MPLERDCPEEACGVFGIIDQRYPVAADVISGLKALQHRGGAGAGVATSTGGEMFIITGAGKVERTFDDEFNPRLLPGSLGIGHVRYPTKSVGNHPHLQPISTDGELVLGHNGNLPVTSRMERVLRLNGVDINPLNDSEMAHRLIEINYKHTGSLEQAIRLSYPLLEGAFSCIAMTKTQMAVFRDSHGIRPLVMGQRRDALVFASETCALDAVGADFVRTVEPGKMIIADQNGFNETILDPNAHLNIDPFEHIYFARPDSEIEGVSVAVARQNLGKVLAREHPIKADIVIGVPDSALDAALGYAKESGIELQNGLLKNRFSTRTFMEQDQSSRERAANSKYNPIKRITEGKRIVVIDDSIVRGTTVPRIIRLLRERGRAKEVYFLSSAPPIRYPDGYGVDIKSTDELIAARMSIEEIRRYANADYLGYISLPGMIEAIGLDKKDLTLHHFTGVYPTPVYESPHLEPLAGAFR